MHALLKLSACMHTLLTVINPLVASVHSDGSLCEAVARLACRQLLTEVVWHSADAMHRMVNTNPARTFMMSIAAAGSIYSEV